MWGEKGFITRGDGFGGVFSGDYHGGFSNGAMRRREVMGMLPIVEYTDTDEGVWLAGVCFATSPLGGITANLNSELGLYRNWHYCNDFWDKGH